MSAGTTGPDRHVVVVVGGACSGAEAAATLAASGITVVVLEQNARPFGKIEDGLPRWHKKQRLQEYEKVTARLSHPGIHFVPLTKMGLDLEFDELAKQWGASAVLLAHGSWKDRPLGIPGVEAFVGRGFYYQNPFIYWFNHYNEKSYDGPACQIVDGAIVQGGGLASIDVMKVLQMELTMRALASRGLKADMHELETLGIPAVLEGLGLKWSDLGLEGTTLYYRRRACDMPVASYKDGATPEQKKVTEQTRVKLLEHAQRKFLFKFEECHAPSGLIIEDGRLVGMEFQRTRIENDRVIVIPDTKVVVRSPLTISSIGSVPEPVAGIPQKGEFYVFDDWNLGKLTGYESVWALGNVVTGKGNIAVSRRHGKFVAEHVAAHYLGLAAGPIPGLGDGARSAAQEAATQLSAHVKARPPLPGATADALMHRVAQRQQAVGYDGNLAAWLEKITPPDLE